jgi:hypothetical protein
MFNPGPGEPSDLNRNAHPETNEEVMLPASCDFILDMNLRQLMIGDYVVLPCFNSVVDRGMVVAIITSIVELMILAPDTGVPETLVLDMRRPDPQTGLFGRYGYTGVMICARKGRPAAVDFARQLLSACIRGNSRAAHPRCFTAARAPFESPIPRTALQFENA